MFIIFQDYFLPGFPYPITIAKKPQRKSKNSHPMRLSLEMQNR